MGLAHWKITLNDKPSLVPIHNNDRNITPLVPFLLQPNIKLVSLWAVSLAVLFHIASTKLIFIRPSKICKQMSSYFYFVLKLFGSSKGHELFHY